MKKNSKDAIVDAAISLFNAKGFQGTTMRDIAGKAKVNIANISYYFENKSGLLEHCFTDYYERYINEIEKGMDEFELGARTCLKKVIENLLKFQCEHMQLTRFVLRELSLDSQVVREIMSTYLVKERFYFTKILENGMLRQEYKRINIHYFIIQLKGLLSTPFLNSDYMTEVLYIVPNEKYFAEKYLHEIFNWIDSILSSKSITKTNFVLQRHVLRS